MRAVAQLPDASDVSLAIDGVIGPSTVLGTKRVLQRLAESYPQILTDLGSFILAPPEESIAMLSETAVEMSSVLDRALSANPTAITTPTPPPEAPPQETLGTILKRTFTPQRVLAGIGALAGLGALAYIARAADYRTLGMIDRTSMLTPSDGSDEMDEYEDDHEDDEQTTALGIDPAKVIEVDSEQPSA